MLWEKHILSTFPHCTYSKADFCLLLSDKQTRKVNPGRQYTAFDFPSLNFTVTTHCGTHQHQTHAVQGSGQQELPRKGWKGTQGFQMLVLQTL